MSICTTTSSANPSIIVRRASSADLATVMRLKTQFAREENAIETMHATEHDWKRDLFGPHPRFVGVLAEDDGETVGLLIYSYKFFPGRAGSAINVHDLYVEASHRRRGVGTALMRHIASEAVSHNMPLIELVVRDDNPAQEFYRRSGFQHLPQCLTYLIAGPALFQLADAVADLTTLL